MNKTRRTSMTGERCPVCGHELVKRQGRFGEYVSCSNYPDCRYKPPKPVSLTGVTCPESGHPLKLRMGKAGLFVACGGWPECTWTVDIPETEEDPVDPSELEGQTCEECGSPMRLRTGRNGSMFLGCTAYPKCRNAISVAVQGGKAGARPQEPTGEKCPVCGHDLAKRHGRFGDYVSCSN